MLRAGKIGESDLERAVAMQRGAHGARRLGDILVETGAISQRELERQMRFQVEEVIFELLSWNEGFFSFEEGTLDDLLPEATVSISTESLLMEGARRIDEWSRIATRIPNLSLVPRLADLTDDRAPQLDLLPNEWEVLSLVDGVSNIRGVAHALARSEFDVARVLYGLVTTGVVEVIPGADDGEEAELRLPGDDSPVLSFMGADGNLADLSQRARGMVRDGKLDDLIGALEELVQRLPASAAAFDELGFAHLCAGHMEEASASLARSLELDPDDARVGPIREVLDGITRLKTAAKVHYDER